MMTKKNHGFLDTDQNEFVKLNDLQDAIKKEDKPKTNRDYSNSYYFETSLEKNSNVARDLLISYKKIHDTLSLAEGWTDRFEMGKMGLSKLPESKLIQKLKNEIEKYRGNIKQKYIDLGMAYVRLSVNLTRQIKSIELIVALILLHASHWIVNDLIDTYPDEDMDAREKYSKLICEIYLNGITKHKNSLLLYDCLKKNTTSKETIELCKTVESAISTAYALFEDHFSSKQLERFNCCFKDMINATIKKVNFTSKEKSLEDYINNRKLSSGTIPYMNIKYLIYCFDYGLNITHLVKFTTDYHQEISQLELQCNLYSGFINDIFSFIRDLEEDNTNLVFILGGKIDSHKLFSGIESAQTLIRSLYVKIDEKINEIFNKVFENEVEYACIVMKAILQETYGATTYYFYSPRYQRETCLIRTFYNQAYNEKQREDKFYRQIKKLGILNEDSHDTI